MPASQVNRQISVKSALGEDVLLFSSMSTDEQLGRLPTFRVRMLSTKSDIKIETVLGKPMGVEVELTNEAGVRHFHGIVTRFGCTGSTGHAGQYFTYEAVIHPWLWLLKKSANCRIFQDMSVLDIVKKVCSVYGGVVALEIAGLAGEYKALAYCVQYRETDFDFVSRLLEDAGIYYYFKHTKERHTMVLADSSDTHQPIPGYDALKLSAGAQRGGLIDESVSHWISHGEIQSTSYQLDDYDFEKSTASASGSLHIVADVSAAFEQASYLMYDYPGLYNNKTDAKALARARIERLHGQVEHIDARTDARGLFAGGLFTLAEHPREDQNRRYLITGTRHEIKGGDYGSGGTCEPFEFECRLSAVGSQYSYRPLRVVARPVVQGPQTAFVVGKAGEEIWTDEYGRVKVQFHWDQVGVEDEHSSCWMRVSQSWAGKTWGAMTVPRIGMEVIVSFLEGDPDRPLVTGCVYNSNAMPPYALPANQTRSTFKTNTGKGGEGFNELRFEDKKGAEEIFVQAERDFNRVVRNNDTLKVGFEVADKGDQTIDIKNDQAVTIGSDQALTVGHDRTVKVANDEMVGIENNQIITIKADQETSVGGKQKVDVGTTLVIEAGTSILLKVGGSSIKIEAGKITIKSADIEISADANAKLKAGAMLDVKAGGVATVAGALVKIN